MSEIYDSWERLVNAVLHREAYCHLCRKNSSTDDSVRTSSDFSSNLTSPLSHLLSPSSSHQQPPAIKYAWPFHGNNSHIKEVVVRLDLEDEKQKMKIVKTVSSFSVVNSVAFDMKTRKLTVIGDFDPILVTLKLRILHHTETELLSLSFVRAS